jgi:putative ABC transport system permease protein
LACIALGVMAIAGVGSLARSLSDGLTREGRVILGGDVAFSLIHREASAAELSFLAQNGRVSMAATMRAMARAPDGGAALVELKAVDAAYPLYGTVALDPPGGLADALAVRGGIAGAVADESLFARLDLQPGARLSIGNTQVEVRAILKTEPDKLAGGIGFGPRLLVGESTLRASGLVQPGSLVRWHYRVALDGAGDVAPDDVVQAARAALPDAGWETRTRANASPALERNIDRFTQFLTLVGPRRCWWAASASPTP